MNYTIVYQELHDRVSLNYTIVYHELHDHLLGLFQTIFGDHELLDSVS